MRWKTFSKFRVQEMKAKIPHNKVMPPDSKQTYRASPFVVKVSSSANPFIAMNLGDKVVTVMDYAGLYKEEGFFIPLDYGTIVGMEWLPDDLLVIGLSNGYIISVNVPLFLLARNNPAANNAMTTPTDEQQSPTSMPKAMATTRVRGRAQLKPASGMAAHGLGQQIARPVASARVLSTGSTLRVLPSRRR
jgi:hypothetical protein